MKKQELKKEIKRIINREMSGEMDFRSDTDTDLLFQQLEQHGAVTLFSVYGRGDYSSDNYWLQTEYYSKKLQMTVIWSYDTGNFDDIDEVVDFIINTSKELRAFEKSLSIKK